MKELRLDLAPEDLKSVRLSVSFGGRITGIPVMHGTVTIRSDVDERTVKAPGGNIELKTSSPVIQYEASADATDLLIEAVGCERSSHPDYHSLYPRGR
jgi:hypothetical protein